MPFQLESSDDSNILNVNPSAVLDDKSRISINGKNNKIKIEANVKCSGLRISIVGDSNAIEIGRSVKISGIVDVNAGGYLHIGHGSTFERVHIICSGASIDIGEDCMFAAGIELRTTDSHPIFDIASGQRINSERGIEVGNHVWVGKQVCLMKGARLGVGSIVALGSIVTGDFPECSMVGGVPARLIRSGVTWSRFKRTAQLADDKVAFSHVRHLQAAQQGEKATSGDPV